MGVIDNNCDQQDYTEIELYEQKCADVFAIEDIDERIEAFRFIRKRLQKALKGGVKRD